MRRVLAIAALLAVVAAGALLVPRQEQRAAPLAKLMKSDMTLVAADRVDGSGAELPQLIVNWGRLDPDREHVITEEGLSVYDEHPAGQRYRRTFVLDPPDQAKQERHRIGHRTQDLDGDGRDEILAVEHLGGSALNYVYHLIARGRGRMRDVYRKELSYDDGFVRFEGGSLVTYEGVLRQPGDHGIHCCWSEYRRTVRKLRNGRLSVVQRSRTHRLPEPD